jgi:hypothetical protein
MSNNTSSKGTLLKIFYEAGYNDALHAVAKLIADFAPYDPYIVGKMKIEERKTELIAAIKELHK